MRRPAKFVLLSLALLAVAVLASACGSEKISVASSSPLYHGAVLFSQRCAGCHTLSAAGTHGSAANVRTAQFNNGPNFDIRCERPATRVLYAIQNGGFSGAVMPQNVVVGQQAREVAQFVATYSGTQAPRIPNVVPCKNIAVGSLPSPTATSAAGAAASSPTGPLSTNTTSSGTKAPPAKAHTATTGKATAATTQKKTAHP